MESQTEDPREIDSCHVPPPTETPPTPSTTPEEAVTDGNDQTSAGRRFTFEQKATIVGTFLCTVTNMVAYSAIAVFYPIEAKKKGLSQLVIGMVFSAFSLSYSLGSPLIGKMIPIVGARFVLLAGSFITAGCNILFGLVIDMPTKATFAGFSFAIRILEGLGSAGALTSSSAILASAFPNDVGKAVGFGETTIGMSFAIGPAVGGFLYHAAGFRIPFFVLGGVAMVTVFVNFFLIPDEGNEAEESGSVCALLSIPAIWVALLADFVGYGATASLEPTLAIFLDELGFSVPVISLFFVASGLGYGVFAMLWGAIADAKQCARILLVIGATVSGAAFLMLGIPQILNPPVSPVIPCVTLPIVSVTLAMLSTPSFVDMVQTAEWHGMPSGIALTAMISGIWNSAFALGTMAGPFLGGVVTEHFGFGYSVITIATTCFFVLVVTCVFCAWEFRCGKGRREPDDALLSDTDSTEQEMTLLPSH